jgi:D-lyxose ketol-isomerase
MISVEQASSARELAHQRLVEAGIVLSSAEAANIEVADFGLGELETTGLQLITYINTERVCAKDLVLFPGQTCPEHRHPSVNGEPGKEETFRCRSGLVYLYVEGAPIDRAHARAQPPRHRARTYTVWREVILKPGEQFTIFPDTLHWFQGGPEGAVVSEFSTQSRDEFDIFTDPEICRSPATFKKNAAAVHPILPAHEEEFQTQPKNIPK